MRNINRLITIYLSFIIITITASIFLFFNQFKEQMMQEMKNDLTQTHQYVEYYINNTFTNSINSYFKALADKTLYDISNVTLSEALNQNQDFKFKNNGYMYITDLNGKILSHHDQSRVGQYSVVKGWIADNYENNLFRKYIFMGNDKYMYKVYSKKHNINLIFSCYVSDFVSMVNMEDLRDYILEITRKSPIDVFIMTEDREVVVHPTLNLGVKIPRSRTDVIIYGKFFTINDNEKKIMGYYSKDNFFNWIISVTTSKNHLLSRKHIFKSLISKLLLPVFMVLLTVSIIFMKLISGLRLQEKNIEIINTQKELLYKLGETVETRSKETSTHVKRVAYLSEFIAYKYGLKKDIRLIIKSASPLHDIGKIGINDNILHKPGKLTKDEYESMKEHTTIGYNILKGSEKPLLKASSIIAHEHHEYWNGKGYPNGKKGEEIHLYARIVNIADVIDALLSKRSYKEPWPSEKVFSFIESERCEMFDPKLVDIVLNNREKILNIVSRIKDKKYIYNY